MTRSMFLACMLLSCVEAHGQSKSETWRCQEGSQGYWREGAPVLVVAVHGEGDTGTVQVAGTEHAAHYSVEGFDRRWDFGPLTDAGLRYAFVIQPDSRARYFDFNFADAEGRAQPRQFFFCRAS